MKKGYFTAFHSGCLKECLYSERPISKATAEKLISSDIYSFYRYDSRINADRYLLVHLNNDIGLPTWLHHYK